MQQLGNRQKWASAGWSGKRTPVTASVLLVVVVLATVRGPGLAAQSVSDRVGSETCLACHDLAPAFFRTKHSSVECEDCHGSGSRHVEAGGEDRGIALASRTPWAVTETCLQCHQGKAMLERFATSSHGRGGVSCNNCHRMHPTEAVSPLLTEERQFELCSGCHPDARAEFRRPNHHPVPEGSMECSDCHQPHATDSRLWLQQSRTSECVDCHPAQRGPFAFEHAPLQIASCADCHQPHGSTNSRLLQRRQVAQLCLECHAGTPGISGSRPFSFHDIRSARYQNCTVCHRAIHGSNVDSHFLR